VLALMVTVAAVAAYATAVLRLCRRGGRWPLRRVGCLLAGSACAAAAVLPPLASHDDVFPVHIVQHLLLSMAGPAFLALSAPITLTLRTLPRWPRHMLLRVLHSSPAAVVSSPAAALVLALGGLYALYLTGLYDAAEQHSLVHAAVHLHMFLAGCLLSWALIGIDPVRGRPGTRGRLAVLVAAAASHDTLAKLMYAWDLPVSAGPVAARHVGAELMYYGGTVIDVALAVIVMAQWYAATGRSIARAARRQALRGLRSACDGSQAGAAAHRAPTSSTRPDDGRAYGTGA
jgi:putative membrane protein